MEISPEMVQAGIKAIIDRHRHPVPNNYPSVFELHQMMNDWLDGLTKELTEHAYSFAELPRPHWKEK